ncbi:MAG: hypothetical protein AB7E59_05225 [Pusillimonas sp.]
MTSSPWGYERPDCIGNHALALFIDDIQRVLDAYADTQGSTDARLFQVQAEANRLLQGYAEHARGTTVFKDQFITIRAVDASGHTPSQWVPLFSPGLKSALQALLKHSQNTTSH